MYIKRILSLQALGKAKITDPSKCLFVDDNRINVNAAKALGWGRCVHFSENGLTSMEGGKLKIIGDEEDQDEVGNDIMTISDLEDLRAIWPDIFRK